MKTPSQETFNNIFEKRVTVPKNKKELMILLYKYWVMGRKDRESEIKQRYIETMLY